MLFHVSTHKETEHTNNCLPHIVLTVGRVFYKCLMGCYYSLDWTTGLTHVYVNSSNKPIHAIKTILSTHHLVATICQEHN